MVQYNRCFCSIFYLSLLLHIHGISAQIAPAPLKERMAKAPHVIEATVQDAYAAMDSHQGHIYTVYVLKVHQVLKGALNTTTVELLSPGGTIFPRREVVIPSLHPSVGQSGLWLLEPSAVALVDERPTEHPRFRAIYANAGLVYYDLTANRAFDIFSAYGSIDGQLYTLLKEWGYPVRHSWITKALRASKAEWRDPLAVSITSFSPNAVQAGKGIILTINGSGFGASRGSGRVEFSNANNGGATIDIEPLSTEYISWSDTQIKVKVPTDAGTGKFRVTNSSGSSATSSSSLTVEYNIINVTYNNRRYRTNLVDSDGSGGYVLKYHTELYNNTQARDAFRRALDTWRCDGTGVYFEDNGTTNIDQAAGDGVNVVRFDNGNELPPGVLGQSYSYFIGCNGGTTWVLDETDLVFNDGTNWNYDAADNSTANNQYDFETVALHELGHSHQLGHVINTNDVMHYALPNGTERRTLSTNDLNAGNDVINFSQGSCGKNNMQIYNCQALAFNHLQLTLLSHHNPPLLQWHLTTTQPISHFILQASRDGYSFTDCTKLPIPSDHTSVYSLPLYRKWQVSGPWYRIKAYTQNGASISSNLVHFLSKATGEPISVVATAQSLVLFCSDYDALEGVLIHPNGTIIRKIRIPSSTPGHLSVIHIRGLSSGWHRLVLHNSSGYPVFDKALFVP